MLVSGKRLSNEMILEYIRRGDFTLTLDEAIKRFGAAFTTVQQIPSEIQIEVPSEYTEESTCFMGLYVPNS